MYSVYVQVQILLIEDILHHLRSLTSLELQWFRAPRWCKISSINSMELRTLEGTNIHGFGPAGNRQNRGRGNRGRGQSSGNTASDAFSQLRTRDGLWTSEWTVGKSHCQKRCCCMIFASISVQSAISCLAETRVKRRPEALNRNRPRRISNEW